MKFSEKQPKPPHLTAAGLLIGLVLTYLTQAVGLAVLFTGVGFSIWMQSVIPFIATAVLVYPLGRATDALSSRVLKRFEKM